MSLLSLLLTLRRYSLLENLIPTIGRTPGVIGNLAVPIGFCIGLLYQNIVKSPAEIPKQFGVSHIVGEHWDSYSQYLRRNQLKKCSIFNRKCMAPVACSSDNQNWAADVTVQVEDTRGVSRRWLDMYDIFNRTRSHDFSRSVSWAKYHISFGGQERMPANRKPLIWRLL